MSKLPPYSTYRTDKKQMLVPQAMSKNNVLAFTPRGFNQEINVKFPDSRLAVCKKCKKNYKTKASCRVRNGHTGPPWNTAYICVTLDESCTGENGKLKDVQFTVRMSNWQPFVLKNDFSTDSPVCASCKRTNRTKIFCRERHQHRQLPWCTVFVILSAVESTDPSTVMAAPSKLRKAQDASKGGDENNSDEGDTDDINKIEPSRTFLAQVSCTKNTIHWLEYMEGEIAPTTTEDDVKALNEAIRTPTAQEQVNIPQRAIPPPPPYYPMMSPEQQQQFFQQHAAWQSQYGHQIIIPPMMQFPPMLPPPPPPVTNDSQTKEDNSDKKDVHVESNESKTQGSNNAEMKNPYDPSLPPSSPEAYAQWHAQMMFHQHMYQQQYFVHHYISHSGQPYITPEGFGGATHGATSLPDTLNTVQETINDDSENATKRQRLESSAAEADIDPIGVIDPTPIDGPMTITHLESTAMESLPIETAHHMEEVMDIPDEVNNSVNSSI